MNTYIDSRQIAISSNSADIYNNGDMLSSCFYNFPAFLKDEEDIITSQISIISSQIPVSYYIVNINNNTLKYKYNTGADKVVQFSEGNYNANTFLTEFKLQAPELTITFNRTNGKYIITATQTFTLYSIGSTCFEVLGLDKGTTYTTKNLNCPYMCQFQGITRMKVVSDDFSTYSMDSFNGGFSNILSTIPVNSSANGIILYENITGYKAILRNKNIDSFTISLLDNDNKFIDFNNCHWYMTLQLDITRKLNNIDRVFPTLTNTTPLTENTDEKTEDIKQEVVIEEENINNNEVELPVSTGDTDLDFLLYQNGIYQ